MGRYTRGAHGPAGRAKQRRGTGQIAMIDRLRSPAQRVSPASEPVPLQWLRLRQIQSCKPFGRRAKFASPPKSFKQRETFGPRAEACLGIDVPGLAEIDEIRSPEISPATRLIGRHPRIVSAGNDDNGKAQRLRRQELRDPEGLGIRRSDKKRPGDSLRVIARCLYGGQGAERVPNDKNRARCAYNFATDSRRPFGQMRIVPIALRDADAAADAALEPGLPVCRPTRSKARHDESCRH